MTLKKDLNHCAACGQQNLYCYSLRRGEVVCLSCFTLEIEMKRLLIEDMGDIEPIEAPMGYMTLTQKFAVERSFDSELSLYSWDC